MNKLIFASDIDNTIMFSYKHRMECDICMEILDGKEQGFCTPNTFALLEQISKKALFFRLQHVLWSNTKELVFQNHVCHNMP